jgi:hypothetical protein
MNAGAGAGGASLFAGLTYGEFEGNLGPSATLVGAFVGTDMDCQNNTFYYDARLASLMLAEEPGTEHVVYRRQIR